MQFIHARELLNGDQFIRVTCDTQCNVQMMDDINFAAYQRGDSYRYQGGFFKKFPAVLVPPYPGNWNVTLDLGGAGAHIRYSITVVTFPNS
jgi:Domain of unknown function (DUF1883)